MHTGVNSLALHPDGNTLLSGGKGEEGDPTILSLWDLTSKTRDQSFIGHETGVYDCFVVAGQVVSYALKGANEGANVPANLRIWDVDGSCVHSLDVEGRKAGKHRARSFHP